ncbi:hypothetical protein D1012_17885 [Pseudotabrizicola alkalilacus]|uniref:Mannonate dehydratase n=1 Tax=Pseudotabrizicola alkalilacus TaxID=2305252 RepID=A0A411YYI0_9RHOB|nr:hypothetical protein D1012_17885 [Pseudotabrizicola alkalilacus]
MLHRVSTVFGQTYCLRGNRQRCPICPGGVTNRKRGRCPHTQHTLLSSRLPQQNRRKAANRADWQIPMRPDHGQDILDGLTRKAQPGYPAIGRLKGLAELRGIMTALAHQG